MTGEPLPKCEFESRRLTVRLDMTVAGDVARISPTVERIMELLDELECAAGKEFEIETALREALANAIVHGCQEDPEASVQVCVACDETRGMLIIVRDPGKGFEADQIPSPVVGRRIFEDHGRGIYLINRLMDEVRFERGGTEIWMRKN